MYKIIKGNIKIDVEKVSFVKHLAESDTIILCEEEDAMGIVAETGEGFYQLEGRDHFGDYPVVTLEKSTTIQSLQKELQELKAEQKRDNLLLLRTLLESVEEITAPQEGGTV